MKFAERLASLGHATYASYLRSDHWQSFRSIYRASDLPQTCRVCDKKDAHLHHISYARLGDERLGDVLPLCRGHHKAVHKWLKANRLSVGKTDKAITAISHCVAKKAKTGKAKTKKRPPKKAKRTLANYPVELAPLVAEVRRLIALMPDHKRRQPSSLLRGAISAGSGRTRRLNALINRLKADPLMPPDEDEMDRLDRAAFDHMRRWQ